MVFMLAGSGNVGKCIPFCDNFTLKINFSTLKCFSELFHTFGYFLFESQKY